jgi:hypothetical protein
MVNDTGVDDMDDMDHVGDTITKKEVDGREVVEDCNSGREVVEKVMSDGRSVVEDCNSGGKEAVDIGDD